MRANIWTPIRALLIAPPFPLSSNTFCFEVGFARVIVLAQKMKAFSKKNVIGPVGRVEVVGSLQNEELKETKLKSNEFLPLNN